MAIPETQWIPLDPEEPHACGITQTEQNGFCVTDTLWKMAPLLDMVDKMGWKTAGSMIVRGTYPGGQDYIQRVVPKKARSEGLTPTVSETAPTQVTHCTVPGLMRRSPCRIPPGVIDI